MTDVREKQIRKKEELEWWNRFSPVMAMQWDLTEPINDTVRKDFIDDFTRFLYVENGRFLDVGCGNGWISRIFADMGMHCTAIDFSMSQIDLAESLSSNSKQKSIRYICHDVINFNSGCITQRYDSIMVNALMHHLDEDEIVQVVNNLGGLLSEKGKIYFYEPFIFNDGTGKRLRQRMILFISRTLSYIYKVITKVGATNDFYRRYKKLGYQGKSPHERSFPAGLVIDNFPVEVKVFGIRPFHVFSLTYGTFLTSLKPFPQKFFSIFLKPVYKLEQLLLKENNWKSITGEKWVLTGLKIIKL